MGKVLNKNLNAAKAAKRDEFYTRLEDIEREVKHYRKYFKGKTVLCNCDDPRMSNFYKFFSRQFNILGLKKLITVCYKSQEADLFSKSDKEKAIWLEYTGSRNTTGIQDPDETMIHALKGDGDFRSSESIELLKQADIVVTNPPFSLFREYVSQLIEYGKKFLIIGNLNAVTYKEVFPSIKENKIWLGINSVKHFEIPDWYEDLYYSQDTEKIKDIDGKKCISFGNICWYTNLEHGRRSEELILWRKYNPDDYPEYDNYRAIEVSKVQDIPEDYAGVMGVPVSYLNKYNPGQFEIVAMTESWDKTKEIELLRTDEQKRDTPYLNNKRKYKRILIKHKHPAGARYED